MQIKKSDVAEILLGFALACLLAWHTSKIYKRYDELSIRMDGLEQHCDSANAQLLELFNVANSMVHNDLRIINNRIVTLEDNSGEPSLYNKVPVR